MCSSDLNCSLVLDILPNIRDWQICASLDGTGPVGEYIRTGLNYEPWVRNFKEVRTIVRHRRQLRIDFTLTLPGLFEILAIEELAAECDVDILAKIMFTFSADAIFSPLSLPRPLLTKVVNNILPRVRTQAMRDMLNNLLSQQVLQEQYTNNYAQAMIQGKNRMLQLEQIRQHSVTLSDCLSPDPDVKAWYDNIG